MFEYDKGAMKAAEIFDKYDLTDFLSECLELGLRDPWDIQHQIEVRDFPELETAIDYLSTDEFMEYLSSRYNVKFEEIILYQMWCPEEIKCLF